MGARLKRLVRARMAETGESYQAALRKVRQAAPVPPASRPDIRLVYCKRCTKTHAVTAGEKECSPGAWLDVDG